MAHKERVLSLYRKVFRMARNWESASGILKDTEKDRFYIVNEARNLFRKNQCVTEAEEIKEHMRECETRLELALHYKIPYPRPVNIPQKTLPPMTMQLKKAQKRVIEQSKPIYLKSYRDFVE